MHFQGGGVYQETRTDELVMHMVIPEHVANVLAQKTLNALAELLHAVGIGLRNAPGSVWSIGRTHLELRDALLHSIIPGDIGDQVLHVRKRLHGLDGYRLIERNRIETRHAHELGHAVDFRGAGPALSRFAIPAHGQVDRRLRLNLMYGVEHHHSFGDPGGVILELARTSFSTPNAKCRGSHHFIS